MRTSLKNNFNFFAGYRSEVVTIAKQLSAHPCKVWKNDANCDISEIINDHLVPILLKGKKIFTKFRKKCDIFIVFFVYFVADILNMDLTSHRFAIKLP